jgi:hypothetical protein
MTTPDTITIAVATDTLEPGTHIARRTIARGTPTLVELPLADCQEIRPDWGVYHPTTTFPAIERALRARGWMACCLPTNQVYRYSIVRG